MGVAVAAPVRLRRGDRRCHRPGIPWRAARAVRLAVPRRCSSRQVAFAASLTLGQVLLAEQRYFWYGIAPLLYNVGIIVGTVAFAPSLGIYGPAIGAVIGAGDPSRQAVHRPPRQRVPTRPRLGGPARCAARVRPARAAEGGEPTGRADHVRVLHRRGVVDGGRRDHGLQLRAELPVACRSAWSVSRSRLPSFPPFDGRMREGDRGGFLRLVALERGAHRPRDDRRGGR